MQNCIVVGWGKHSNLLLPSITLPVSSIFIRPKSDAWLTYKRDLSCSHPHGPSNDVEKHEKEFSICSKSNFALTEQ
jgi:hypothetical protein